MQIFSASSPPPLFLSAQNTDAPLALIQNVKSSLFRTPRGFSLNGRTFAFLLGYSTISGKRLWTRVFCLFFSSPFRSPVARTGFFPYLSLFFLLSGYMEMLPFLF